MSRLPTSCNAENSVLEPDIAAACRSKKLDFVHVHEVPVSRAKKRGSTTGYHVVVKLKGSSALRYMTTKREREQPRMFLHLGRLMLLLRGICPAGSITLYPSNGHGTKVKPKRS